MADDHHEEERSDYEPTSPSPPEREPPLRSTAPQSDYTTGQVGVGFVILLVGLALTFGLPFVLG
ncbi:MAG: hypothetical protein V5A39_04770 [Haloarculaceae archaeon]|jgi:hypothetical protein